MSLELEVLSNTRQAQQDLSKLDLAVGNIQKSVDRNNNAFQGLAKSAQTSLSGIDNSVRGVVSSLKTMAVTLGGVGAVMAATLSITRITDQFINMRSQLDLATRSQSEFNAAFRDTSYIAVNTRQNLSSVASLYSKISYAAQSFGGSRREVAVFTQSVAKSIAASGSSAQASSAAIEQLGQALASGTFQGDELRSILENAPALARTIADGLGKSIGDLRTLGAAGKLTARDIFGAVLKESENVDARFKKMGVTYSSAFENLGNSFNLLFDAVSRSFGSSTGTFADKLNGIAISISNIAFSFDHLVLQAKTKLLLFAADVVGVFDSLSGRLAKGAALSTDFEVNVSQINLKDFIPDLHEMQDIVGKWVYNVERMFFWLYDEVIGHSWIPDLVEGIIKWTSKLVQAPLSFVNTFVSSAISLFAKLFAFASNPVVLTFTGLSAITAFATSGGSDKFSGLVNKIAIGFNKFVDVIKDSGQKVWEIIKELYAKVKQKLNGDSENKLPFQKYLPDSVNKKIELAQSTIEDIKRVFDKSTFGHNFKQFFGIRDNRRDTIPGRTTPYDTSSYVGRGPQRNSQERTIGHDFFNMLPDDYQLPVFAGLSAAIMGAIVLAMDSSPLRSVVLGLFTTGAGVFAANIFYDKDINKFTSSITNGILSGLKTGMDVLFGQGIFTERDPFSLLLLIAKLSLLFEAGRKYMLATAGSIATAPTTVALSAVDRGVLGLGRYQEGRLTKAIQTLPTVINAKVQSTAAATAASSLALANATNANGTRVGATNAAMFVNSGGSAAALAQFSGAARLAAIEVSRNIQLQRLANNALAQLPGHIAALNARQAALNTANTALATRVAEQTAAARRSLVGFGSNAGGALGSVYGFNMGRKLAEGMEGYSDWAKIGVTVGAALAGQFVFAVVGSGLVTTLLNPFIMGAAILGATLFSVFKKFNSFSDFSTSLGRAIDIGIAKFVDATPKWISILMDWTPEWVKKFLPDNIAVPKVVNPVAAPTKPGAKYTTPDLSSSLRAAESLASNSFKSTFDSAVEQTREIHKILDNIKAMDELISSASDLMLAIPRFDTAGKDVAKGVISQMQDQKFALVRKLEDAGGQPLSVLKGAEQLEYRNRTPGYIPPVIGPGSLEPLQDLQYKLGVVFEKAANDISAKSTEAFNGLKQFLLDVSSMRAGTDVPIRRANGGAVWGAGSATSDSIPALLSNGEFVVNAKATSQNRELLETINSGGIPRFANGGAVDTSAVDKWKEYARNAATKAGINPDFVVNLITVESNWDPSAVSSKGAAGLGQMMKATAADFKIPYADLFDPIKSIDATIQYLSRSIERFGKDQLKLAIAYNAGDGGLSRNMAKNGGSVNISTLPEETIHYTAKLKAAGSDLAGGISAAGSEFKGAYKDLDKKARELRKAGGDAFISASAKTDDILVKVTDSANGVAKGFLSLFEDLSGDFSKDFVTVYERAKKMAISAMKSPEKPPVKEEDPAFSKQYAETPDMLGNYTLLGKAFSDFGVSTTLLDSFFNSAAPLQEQIIQEVDGMYRLQEAMAKSANPVLKKNIAKQISDISDNIAKALKTSAERSVLTGNVKSAEGAATGVQAAQVLQKSVVDNLRNTLLGNQKLHKGLRNILFSFSEQVFNTVTESFVKGATNKLSEAVSSMISEVFDGGLGLGNWLSELIKPTAPISIWGVDTPKVPENGSSIFTDILDYLGVGGEKAPVSKPVSVPSDSGVEVFPVDMSGDFSSEIVTGVEDLRNSITSGLPALGEQINVGLGETFMSGISGLLGSLDGVFRSIFSVFNSMGTGSAGGVNWLGIAFQVAGAVAGYSGGTASTGSTSGAGSGANLPDMGGGQGLMAPSGAISSGASISSSSVSSQDWLKGVKFAGNYAIGGIVPGPLASPQAVMAHGGEVILNSQQQKALLNGGTGGNTQNITLNIQGDVSRQTRSEILKMMPQIALGVNSQNREAGTR